MIDAFEAAIADVLEHEGGYVNDPDDPGGETYCGISRRYFPGWGGWFTIDDCKSRFGPNWSGKASPLASDLLEVAVGEFYRKHFWDRFQGDKLAEIGGPDLPIELFDQAVNLGVGRAVQHLQQAMNILNLNQTIFPDLEVDGGLGPYTLSAVEVFASRGELSMVVNLMNIIQGGYYIEKMIENPVKEKYRGWFKRVQLKRWES